MARKARRVRTKTKCPYCRKAHKCHNKCAAKRVGRRIAKAGRPRAAKRVSYAIARGCSPRRRRKSSAKKRRAPSEEQLGKLLRRGLIWRDGQAVPIGGGSGTVKDPWRPRSPQRGRKRKSTRRARR